MLKKLTVLIGTSALVLTTFAMVGAQEPQASANTPEVQRPQKRGVFGRRLMRRRARRGTLGALRALNLTDAQKQQAQTIIRTNFESNKALREELAQLLQKRRTGTLTEADQARARELRKQLHESRQNARTQLAGLLTDEQKANLEERRKNRRENRERFGRRGPNRPI